MSFGEVEVLHGVDFQLLPGEVCAITGENGAGKSTLAKILAGVHRPTAGAIQVNGKPVSFQNPLDAGRAGIALVHQEPLTFPDLTVAENIFVGAQPRSKLRTVDWRRMEAEASALLKSLDLDINPKSLVQGLSQADRQMVEVASALALDARVIFFDETTASLTPKEVEDLFAIIRRLRQEGRAIAIVSHRLEELFSICDRVTVLRDGSKVGGMPIADTSIPDVIRLMVGRELKESSASAGTPGKQVLTVQNLTVPRRLKDVSFEVRAGEIVGMAGLVGSGRTDVAHCLYGLTRFAGALALNGQPFSPKNPMRAMQSGVALVPEDRQHHGVLAPMAISQNISLPILRRLTKLWLAPATESALAKTWIEKLRVVCQGPLQPIRELSGGNQQKVSVARALETQPKLLVVDEPTRGVDVGAKAEVHALLREIAAGGMAILMISSDLPEVLELSDRILVMREGSIVQEFPRAEATQDKVLFAATGQEAIHA